MAQARMLYPNSVEDERGQEITEGLAAYTGTVLAAQSAAEAIASAIDLLANAETAALEASLVRSFPYMSGPAYGLLLDASSPGWTRRVRGIDDLATLVMRALAVKPTTDATASATRYGGAEIRASEQKREQERQERIAELRRRFVDGPVLLFPGGSHSYDTRGAVVIPGVGTVYFGTTGDSGDPSATDLVLRESSRVAAVVANYPPTDLGRWATQQSVFKLTEAEAAQFSPIRFVSSGSAPSLIVHGDADTAVPIDQGETMHAALTKAGVPASFIRIKGAGHGFEGAAPADLERAYTALMQWFEQHLRGATK